MSVPLSLRVDAARALLAQFVEVLDADGSKLPGKLENSFRDLTSTARGLDAVPGLLLARDKSVAVLKNLDNNVKGGVVEYGGVELSFAHARLFAVQSYVAVLWSIADLVSEFVSSVYCSSAIVNNPRKTAKLWEHFVRDDQVTALSTHFLARQAFGLPVAVAYIIRNFFVHEGGQHEGGSMFAGPTAGHRFALSTDGWKAIEKKLKDYKVQVTETRAPEQWPWPTGDLRAIIEICEREIDDLLGILLGTACTSVGEQAAFLLGVR